MTGEAFEGLMCDIFKDMGYWALKIPKNHHGAQPFDVLAMKGDRIFAVDCKVCSHARFPLARIEDNQWTAMQSIKDRTNANLGFACYYDGEVYFILFDDILCAQENGNASMKLTDKNKWLSRDDILEV